MNFHEEIRARVRNMAGYFVNNTIKVDKRKLNKLFYLSDVAAYKKTAFAMSDQDYVAQKFGPVPVTPVSHRSIWDEYSLKEITHCERGICSPKDGVSFDDGEFTDRELTILRDICQDYYSMTAGQNHARYNHLKLQNKSKIAKIKIFNNINQIWLFMILP